MILLEETARYFKFKYTGDHFKWRGISAQDSDIWFPKCHSSNRDKLQFNSIRECVNFMEARKVKNEDYIKEVTGVEGIKSANVEADWDAIKSQMVDSEGIQPDEVAAFSMTLANNFIDSDDERFSLPVLRDFKESIVGKMRLLDHANAQRVGKFYFSNLEQMNVKDTMSKIRFSQLKDIERHLTKIVEIENSIYFLTAKYFMPNKTDIEQQRVRDVKNGIDYYTSIRFRCPELVPVYDGETDNIMWFEWRTNSKRRAEALEGSGVWLGSQAGTVSGKSAGGKHYPDGILENLPHAYLPKWDDSRKIRNHQLRKLAESLDEMIGKGMIFATVRDGRKSFMQRTDADLDTLDFTIEKSGIVNLAALRVTIPKHEMIKESGEAVADLSGIIKYLSLFENEKIIIKGERMKFTSKFLGKEFELTDDVKTHEQLETAIGEVLAKASGETKEVPAELTDDQKVAIAFHGEVLKTEGVKGLSVPELAQAVSDQKDLKDELIRQIVILEKMMKVLPTEELVNEAKAKYEKDSLSFLRETLKKDIAFINSGNFGYKFDGFILTTEGQVAEKKEEKPEIVSIF